MSRPDALLRLRQRLVARRDALRDKLSLNSDNDHVDVGDLGDVASEGSANELNSQLASIETRELQFIERAIQMIHDGAYGRCESCQGEIPVARLQALPYSVLCVNCQRADEEQGATRPRDVDWGVACDYEVSLSEQEVRLSDLEIDR